MPQPLAKIYPHLDLPRCQAQVCEAMRRAFASVRPGRGAIAEFNRRFNALRRERGEKEITRQAMEWWASEGTFVDRSMWPLFEEITDMLVTRRHLRPDLYGFANEWPPY